MLFTAKMFIAFHLEGRFAGDTPLNVCFSNDVVKNIVKNLHPAFSAVDFLLFCGILLHLIKCQLSSVVEQRFCKPSVVGSNPTAGSIFYPVSPGNS